MSLQKNIRDLIFFYVKTNYNQYLEERKLKYIMSKNNITMAITLLAISGICILGAGLLVVHAWIYRKKQKALLKELADEAT